MDLTRRDLIKLAAASTAAAAASISLPALGQNVITSSEYTRLQWDKAPCRFCGTGCSVNVATRDNQVVATHGDILSPVNRGINCIKGYFLSKIMDGADRLTQPLLRMRNGRFHKEGEFTPVSWEQAFDIMAEKFKQALRDKGPSAIGIFGSGQWTIWEGYTALKLFKAGFRTNNVDPNARHCMASAAYAFMRTFGMDEPMGCYDDIEAADAFVLWGSNMAEMHPILWTRVADRRLSAPGTRVAVLSTFEHRSFELADLPIIFAPQSDLAIANYIARYIIEKGAVNEEFVKKHTKFKLGNTDIGYGLRAEHPLERAAANAHDPGGAKDISFEDYAEFVRRYDAETFSRISGVPRHKLDALAELYADPDVRVMSFWTMGFNQHTRGVWANHLVYNLHLLTGKISTPGNSPFSLTGQPSACGTTREVGTFAHRLPADLMVDNPEHRAIAERIWKLPPGTIPSEPGFHAVEMNRKLRDGELNAYWVQVNNNGQAAANINEELIPGYRNPDNFIVVSDAYPTVTTQLADLILPAAMWVEKEGAYGNAERRTQFWRQLVQAPGEARAPTSGSSWSSPSASGPRRSGRRSCSPRRRSTGARRCSTCCSETARWIASPSATSSPAIATTSPRPSASTSRKACSRNTPPSAAATATTWPPSSVTTRSAACAGRWSTARKPSGATRKATTPTSSRAPAGSSTASRMAAPTSTPCPTNRRRRRRTRNTRSGWSPAASSSTGTRAPSRGASPNSTAPTRTRRTSCIRKTPARWGCGVAPKCASSAAAARSAPGSRPAAATSRPRAWCMCPGSIPAS